MLGIEWQSHHCNCVSIVLPIVKVQTVPTHAFLISAVKVWILVSSFGRKGNRLGVTCLFHMARGGWAGNQTQVSKSHDISLLRPCPHKFTQWPGFPFLNPIYFFKGKCSFIYVKLNINYCSLGNHFLLKLQVNFMLIKHRRIPSSLVSSELVIVCKPLWIHPSWPSLCPWRLTSGHTCQLEAEWPEFFSLILFPPCCWQTSGSPLSILQAGSSFMLCSSKSPSSFCPFRPRLGDLPPSVANPQDASSPGGFL